MKITGKCVNFYKVFVFVFVFVKQFLFREMCNKLYVNT